MVGFRILGTWMWRQPAVIAVDWSVSKIKQVQLAGVVVNCIVNDCNGYHVMQGCTCLLIGGYERKKDDVVT